MKDAAKEEKGVSERNQAQAKYSMRSIRSSSSKSSLNSDRKHANATVRG